ncbi:MAG: hypothetical protein S4CHLAM45_07950 [Chlamydiales bacterium]|nr:hypothetical protein [Chlamydiales bacterium]MCH9619995.1 hypothetical protein [Chlamydiales bacterium]MCH9622901.1 hypothetical protein [Chlamydiales bacterium]
MTVALPQGRAALESTLQTQQALNRASSAISNLIKSAIEEAQKALSERATLETRRATVLRDLEREIGNEKAELGNLKGKIAQLQGKIHRLTVQQTDLTKSLLQQYIDEIDRALDELANHTHTIGNIQTSKADFSYLGKAWIE